MIIPFKSFVNLLLVAILGLAAVYIGRGDEAFSGALDILVAIIFRIPLIFEGSFVLDHVINFGAFPVDFTLVHEFVTSEVFNLNPRFTGVASSYLGFFWSLNGLFGTLIAFVFPLPFMKLFGFLLSSGSMRKIRLFLYFIWSIELVPFFIDGNISFITGTNGYMMFYSLLILTFVVIFAKFILARRVIAPKNRGVDLPTNLSAS